MVSRVIDWRVGPDDLVLGNIGAELVDEGGTVLVFKFGMRGYGVEFSRFVKEVENIVDKVVGSARVGFIMKEVGEDTDMLSQSPQRFWAEYRVSILGDKREVIERFLNYRG